MKKILSILFSLLIIGMTAMPAFADDAQTITEVRLYITEPAVGEAPDRTIESAEPDKYTTSIRYWIKRMYPNELVEVFEEGYEYGLVFEVKPVAGYKFAAVEKNDSNFNESPTVVYLNGQKTHCCSTESDTLLARAYVVTPTSVEPEKPVSFFRKVINAIKGFFTKIADFFRKLFGLK